MLLSPVFCTIQVTVTMSPGQTVLGGGGTTCRETRWKKPSVTSWILIGGVEMPVLFTVVCWVNNLVESLLTMK